MNNFGKKDYILFLILLFIIFVGNFNQTSMKSVDYIIVGDGYAALFFAHQLIKHQKSFVLFSEGKIGASQVSAGIINPVVLKKFTAFWKAQEQISHLQNTLSEMETYLGKNFLINAPIHRIFHDERERELWLKKSKNEELTPFLSSRFSKLNHIENPFGTGKVNQSARLDVKSFFNAMLSYLSEHHYLIKEKCDYSEINLLQSVYKEHLKFNKIIFAEGMGIKENPYFSELAINPNKGHYIEVKLKEHLPNLHTIKKKHFLFPLTNSTYYYGGTYDRNETSCCIDHSAVEQLQNGLKEFYKQDFEIVNIRNGFRPTVKDRRPFLGVHKEYKNLFVFNGLGTRGILNGSYFSQELYLFIEYQKTLPKEVELYRFDE